VPESRFRDLTMAVRRDDILEYLDGFLDVATGSDYGPNGLQVGGCEEITRVALGVTASQELFAAAIGKGAQLIIVHHGLIFAPVERLTGLFARRVRELLRHDVNLAAYHLPLDRHPEVGNNAVLCRHLGVADTRPFGEVRGAPLGLVGELQGPALLDELAGRLERACGQAPRVLALGPRQVQRVAVVTGAGAPLIEEAGRLGTHVFVTGELPEWAHETCRELGLSALLCGHYASERFGVQALAGVLATRFGIEATFIDVPNPL
jgi:dinuclear metal center YbgI/SA1388 family protein